MKPQITVGMPVYNERKYITETLDSLLSQTYENFEVVISDSFVANILGRPCKAIRT